MPCRAVEVAVVEGCEDDARPGPADPRGRLDGAAQGFDPHGVALGDAELLGIMR
jgi:hypothetical protein